LWQPVEIIGLVVEEVCWKNLKDKYRLDDVFDKGDLSGPRKKIWKNPDCPIIFTT